MLTLEKDSTHQISSSAVTARVFTLGLKVSICSWAFLAPSSRAKMPTKYSVRKNSIITSRLRNLTASAMLSARKRIQVRLTKKKVISQFSAGWSFSNQRLKCRVITENNPWRRPHSTNVQLAPCQSPLARKTIITLQ